METNNLVQKLFLKPRPFATLALIGATIFTISLSSCDNAAKNKAKTDSLATKTEEKSTEKVAEKSTENVVKTDEKTNEKKVENPTGGVEIDVTFLRATWYAGSTKYYFKDAKGAEIEIGLLNDGMEDAKLYNPKMPKESLLEGDDPKREGPPSENPAFVGKKFKIIYDVNEKEKVIEIRKNF